MYFFTIHTYANNRLMRQAYLSKNKKKKKKSTYARPKLPQYSSKYIVFLKTNILHI